MANRGAKKRSARSAKEPDELVELPSRLVFSLLKAAVRLAARFDMPMDRLVQLAQLAYFEELRGNSPRDLSGVAKRLGLSLRSVSTLNRKFKLDFFRPETEVEPLRRITATLLRGPQTRSDLESALGEHEADDARLDRVLKILEESGWVETNGDQYVMKHGIRSFIDDTLKRRIDGLNNQMEILAKSVWSRFMQQNEKTAAARSWAFAARDADLEEFIERTTKTLRHEAIDVEEAALSEGSYNRYGVTIAVTPLEDDS